MNARVLFVDDESRVLQGMRRALFAQGVDWQTDFATSGEIALKMLEAAPFDAVISDMQMMPMDGAELLRHVRERWPSTLRFVLSGHVEAEAAVRALQAAQQMLSKPCDTRRLVEAVQSGLATRKLLSDPLVYQTIGRLTSLPAAPRVHAQISAALADPRCDAKLVAGILARDPALAANVLQMANSAFFNSGGRAATDMHQAVARVGLTTVSDIVLATEVFDAAVHGRAVDQLRDRALRSSRLAARIAAGSKDAGTAATAALLADIGYLLPGVDRIDVSQSRNALSEHAHAELGASLLALWALPMSIVETVANHHAPGQLPQQEFGVRGIVHVATALVCGEEPDHDFLAAHNKLGSLSQWKALCASLGGQSHD